MGFENLKLKQSYSSYEDDILHDFYIPVLSEAVKYDRIAGFFSSSSLSLTARGVSGILKNNGIMRVITSPLISENDIDIINHYVSGSSEGFEDLLLRGICDLDEVMQNDHLSAFFWLLSKGKLEIKIAVPHNSNLKFINGLFHIKIGILQDSKNRIITFSGSINETASAWLSNTEEFKVFDTEKLDQCAYCETDKQRFDDLWNNKLNKVLVVDLPQAVKEVLIKKAPIEIDSILTRITESRPSKEGSLTPYENLSLFENQQNAVTSWFSNGKKGMFEMATGTGKTRTAIGCILKLIELNDIGIVIISAPQNTILRQWIKEIERIKLQDFRFDLADSTNPKWKMDIINNLLLLQSNIIRYMFIFTTHASLSSKSFIDIFGRYRGEKKILLVGDEVHGLGANLLREGLQKNYHYRLGLSATPQRWFDETGSELLCEYFGDVVYSFPIQDALITVNPVTHKPYLVNYKYYPVFIELTDEEAEEYKTMSDKLAKFINKGNNADTEAMLERLLFKRAEIQKRAVNKLGALGDLLDETQISNAIIYTSPKQKNEVLKILAERRISCHEFTEKEGTSPSPEYNGLSEREYLIKKFVSKQLSALVAIKCLDEGIDIPSANMAVIMASSSNPREYIQRIGRVIRQDKEKLLATIYDFIVIPCENHRFQDYYELEMKIFKNELKRAAYIARSALNGTDAITKLYSVMEEK